VKNLCEHPEVFFFPSRFLADIPEIFYPSILLKAIVPALPDRLTSSKFDIKPQTTSNARFKN